MKPYEIALSLLFISIFLCSCERENFSEVVDIPLPEEPVLVEYEGGFLYAGPSGNERFSRGNARVTGDNGQARTFAISSDSLVCNPGGGISIEPLDNGDNFLWLEFYSFEEEYYSFNAIMSAEVDGQLRVLYAIPVGANCERTVEIDLNITELTDEYVSGTFTSDFYAFPNGPLNDTLPCLGFEPVGAFTAEFSLPFNDPC